jgi:hypothetical protein
MLGSYVTAASSFLGNSEPPPLPCCPPAPLAPPTLPTPAPPAPLAEPPLLPPPPGLAPLSTSVNSVPTKFLRSFPANPGAKRAPAPAVCDAVMS